MEELKRKSEREHTSIHTGITPTSRHTVTPVTKGLFKNVENMSAYILSFLPFTQDGRDKSDAYNTAILNQTMRKLYGIILCIRLASGWVDVKALALLVVVMVS
jgi:hypothetical protein